MDFKVIVSLSTVPTMLDEADSLIALASDPTQQARHTLAACAAVMLAVSIDQGTLTALDTAARTAQAGGNARLAASIRDVFSGTLRHRIVRMPEILTKGKFRLDRRNDHVLALHNLVTLRNELMHVMEEPEEIVTSFDLDVPPEYLHIDAPSQLSNSWLTVKLADVEKYRVAVHLYVEEVLFPPNNEIRKGKIVMA